MAQGGDDFGFKDTDLDDLLDEKDDSDDEKEVNRTRPFQPDAASTPYHRGEAIEMQNMQHEQSGLPDTSYSDESMLERAKEKIRNRFPTVNFQKMPPIGFSKAGNRSEIVAFNQDGKEDRIFFKKARPDGERSLLKYFTDKFSKALGKPAAVLIGEYRDTIREKRKSLVEAEKEFEQAQALTAKIEQEHKKIEELRQKTESTQARIDAIQDEQGSNLEREAELRRLIQLKKNYQTDLENKKNELASLTKQAKSREKEQAKVDSLRASLAEKERETNAIYGRKTEQFKGFG